MQIVRKLAFASVSAFALATPAVAQDAPSEEGAVSSEGMEIVVEARRRGESAQDVPLVVNAVTAETIDKLNLRDFRDIQTVVPGLTMASNSNGIGTTSSVRGVNFDVNASGAFGTIEYYLNDSPMTSGAIFQAMYDIGQIEVLRGPQGTLRGKASPSGSITISHRKPNLSQPGGYVTGTVNNIGGVNVNGAINVPIIQDVLAVRLSGLVEEGRGNRVRSINAPDIDPFAHTKSGRIFLRLEPADNVSFEGVYQRIETESEQFEQAACFSYFSSTAPACPVDIRPEDRRSIKKAPGRTEQQYNVYTWKASAGFAGQRVYYNGQYSEQFVQNFQPGDDANVVSSVFCATCTDNESKFTVHEVRLQSEERIANIFDYVVGYFKFKQDSPSYLFNGTALNSTSLVRFSATKRASTVKEESMFANLTAHLGERTELSGGARRIKIVNDGRIITSIPAGCTNSNTLGLSCPFDIRFLGPTDLQPIVAGGTLTELVLAGATNPRTFKKTIFSASAKHRFSEDLMVYANFGTSFRPGTNVVRLPANARTSLTEAAFLFLPAETSKSYEVGFKSEFLDDTLTLNVAAYQQDFVNYPYRSSSGVPALRYNTASGPENPVVQNVNFVAPVPVRVRGFEAELAYRPSARFNMSANVSYARGKIRNGQIPCLDINGDGIPDAAPPVGGVQPGQLPAGDNVAVCRVNFRSSNASPWGANAQAEYNMPIGNVAEGFVRGLMSYSGSSLNDPANSFDDYGSYARLNLYVGLRDPDGAWEVTAYGKNLFDNHTVLATTNGPVTTTVGSATVPNNAYIGLGNASTPGMVPGREFGLTARIAFGSR